MTHALQGKYWSGYCALLCVGIIILASRVGFIGNEPVRALGGIIVTVVGVYFAIRGTVHGTISSRICAGLALSFWLYLAYLLQAVMTHARLH